MSRLPLFPLNSIQLNTRARRLANSKEIIRQAWFKLNPNLDPTIIQFNDALFMPFGIDDIHSIAAILQYAAAYEQANYSSDLFSLLIEPNWRRLLRCDISPSALIRMYLLIDNVVEHEEDTEDFHAPLFQIFDIYIQNQSQLNAAQRERTLGNIDLLITTLYSNGMSLLDLNNDLQVLTPVSLDLMSWAIRSYTQHHIPTKGLLLSLTYCRHGADLRNLLACIDRMDQMRYHTIFQKTLSLIMDSQLCLSLCTATNTLLDIANRQTTYCFFMLLARINASPIDNNALLDDDTVFEAYLCNVLLIHQFIAVSRATPEQKVILHKNALTALITMDANGCALIRAHWDTLIALRDNPAISYAEASEILSGTNPESLMADEDEALAGNAPGLGH